jgi:NAD(P)-dependent dehydrogenase (short-subunit alcohol dehydrogenase family)
VSASLAGRSLFLVDATGRSGRVLDAVGRGLAGGGARVTRLGAGDEDVVERTFDEALAAAGGLGGLVLAVDLARADRPLVDTSPEDWASILDDCLRTPFLVLRRGLQEILAGGGGGGAILLIASPRRAEAAALPAALQSGFVSMVRSLATEYGRRSIACHALLVEGDTHETAQPAAVLESVLFLVSDEAAFVNGEVLDLRRR